jgi:AAA+ superfamily predicted ATPase
MKADTSRDPTDDAISLSASAVRPRSGCSLDRASGDLPSLLSLGVAFGGAALAAAGALTAPQWLSDEPLLLGVSLIVLAAGLYGGAILLKRSLETKQHVGRSLSRGIPSLALLGVLAAGVVGEFIISPSQSQSLVAPERAVVMAASLAALLGLVLTASESHDSGESPTGYIADQKSKPTTPTPKEATTSNATRQVTPAQVDLPSKEDGTDSGAVGMDEAWEEATSAPRSETMPGREPTVDSPDGSGSDNEDTPADTGDGHNSGDEGDSGSESDSGKRQMVDEFQFYWEDATDVTMDDIGGMEELKAGLRRDIIRPLSDRREAAERFGIPLPNVLFHGPPGTGKTFMAKALATELGLPFVQLSGADVTSKWINESSQKVNQLFTEAAQKAETHGGAVIFLDELDAVLPARDGQMNEETRKVVNEFLAHLQETGGEDVLFIGATNARDDLDDAATRTGRMDKEIHIGKPDYEARLAILAAQLADRPSAVDAETLERVAEQTDGLVAADLEGIVDQAARHALFERDGEQITRADMEHGLDAF